MGIVVKGSMRGVKGKVGDVVYAQNQGVTIVKTYNESPSNPQTTAQMAQRSAMSLIVAFARTILSFIRKSFNNTAAMVSGFNAFVSANIALIDPLTLTIRDSDASRLIFSKGSLTPMFPTGINIMNGVSFQCALDESRIPAGTDSTDKASAILFCSAKNKMVIMESIQSRSGGSITITGSDFEEGDNVHIYLVAHSTDFKKYSDTAYAGSIVKA